MSDLIQELEQAQEGSRELDAKVAVQWLYLDSTDEAYVKLPNQYDTEAQRGDYWLVQRSGKQLKAAPHYTTNLQDALGLVPEGMGYVVSDADWSTARASVAWKNTPLNFDAPKFDVRAATPALALTIAALCALKLGQDND